MDCAEAKLRIEPFVAGTLAPGERGALEEHLESCAECRLDAELSKAANRPASESAKLEAPMGPSPAATASAAAPKEDWTLDKIFGGGVATAQPPPVSAAGVTAPSDATVAPPAATAANAPVFTAPAPAVAPPAAAAVPSAPAAPLAPAVARPAAVAPPAPTAAANSPGPLELSSLAPDAGEPDPTPAVASVASNPKPPARAPEPPAAPSSAEVFEPSAISAELTDPPMETPVVASIQPAAEPTFEDDDEGPVSDAPSWDFEPADAKSGAKPPEGSLFFAEEALARSSTASKKGSTARLILWMAGGVIGLGLLGVSIWLAVALQNPQPQTQPLEAVQPVSPSDPAPPDGAIDSLTTPAPTATSGAPGGAPVITSNLGPGAALPSSPSVPSAPQATAPTNTKTATAPTAGKIAPTTSASGTPAKPIAGAPGAGSKATTSVARAPARTGTGSKASATTPIVLEDEAALELASPGPSRQAATTLVTTPKPSGTGSAPVSPAKPTPTAAAPADSARTPSPVPGSPSTIGGSTTDAVQRPIDRIHLATVKAQVDADLPALRKLRDTWKGFVKSSVGPDRARAKRELADCLWAIQTLTLRKSDQKEALLAYRDYVLNAPAGGADARTVSRMRQLEDAVDERH